MDFETLIRLDNGSIACTIKRTRIAHKLPTYEQLELLTELKKRQARRIVPRADLREAIDIVANECGRFQEMSIYDEAPKRTYIVNRNRRF